MRYSKLVYLTRMSETLLEAAQYLHTAPAGAIQTELQDNGRKMLWQIRTELEHHQEDLCSETPLHLLDEIDHLWEENSESLDGLLKQFAVCLPQNVRYQVRAVFYAELGEKWDSMESVYQFMRDDPRFDPVVVLTPVFRVVNRNGKQEKDVIYKDYLTPMKIPFVDYRNYDLEKDCPDVAFICQPYESCTVKEAWPETIAKYTRLVYLPYGLPGPVFEEFRQSYCQLPVYGYAWKTVCMNENWEKFYKKYAVNGGNNMLVTGLPKVDPIVALKNHSVPLPDAWKNVLKDRRVILWNTRYSFVMSSIPYFENIVTWLDKHPDCAVIWRPHPMTETVTKLYMPENVYKFWRSCVEFTKAAPNMIFDEEASFLPAFSSANALLSDYSTMMFQYLILDRPVCWTGEKKGEFGNLLNEYIVDWHWMEYADNVDQAISFLDRVAEGIDVNAAARRKVLNRDLALADGRCGERLSNALWDIMHQEDRILV